MEAAGAT
jgi:hypothetical protein